MGLTPRRHFTTLLIFTMIVFACATRADAQGRSQRPEKTTVIVKMANGVSQADSQATIRKHGGSPRSSIAQLGMVVVEIPTVAAEAVTKRLKEDPSVARVEENHTRKLSAIPSDSLYESQWALPQIAWDQVYGTALPIGHADVAILDTGIDAAHPDLIGAIGPGASMIDSSQGRTDENGHGTWVAGIVAGRTNNLDGIAGVGYSNVQVLPIKVLDAEGLGQDGDIIAGILWAVDHNASVILMAFSNPGYSANLQDAIDYAWSRGVVLVAAAGNDATNTATFPAGDKSVIGVSATDQYDVLAPTSNFGPSIFMAAPGVDIVSTYKNGAYIAWSGSSASAAFVAGAAAFMRAMDPSLTNGAVVGRLARNADPAGTQDETGNGRLQMARALADTLTEEVQPMGAPPVGDGGPFVGPYRIAALNSVSIGPPSPANVFYGTGDAITYAINLTGNGNTKRNLTVNWSAPGAPAGVTISTNVPNPTANCNLSSTNCDFTLTIAAATNTPVLTRTFTVTVNDVTSIGTATFSVTPKPASVTPSPASKIYGSGDPALTGTLSGFLGADSVTASYTRTAGETVSGSPYTISATLSPGGVLSNYAITYNTASLTINKAPSVTTVTCPPNVTYTGASLTPCNASVTGAGGLNLAPTPTYSNNTNAGTATASYNYAGDDNHTASGDSKNFVIKKADATITVNGYTGVYDGNAHGATGSATGINSEDLSGLLNLGSSFTDVPGGTANWAFAGNGNYNAATGTADVVITRANASITVTGYRGVYDGNAHGATGSAAGLNSEDLSSVLNLGASFTNVPGGTANWSFAGNGNYSTASGTADIVISKTNASITVNGYTGVYDGHAHSAAGSATGVNGESLSALLDLGSSFTNVPGGTANWSFAGNGNYNAANGTADIVISKANASITVNGYTGVYDGNAHGATGSAAGLNSEDLTSLLNLGASFTNVPGGTAHWSFAGNSNYNAADGSADVTISKADAAVLVKGYAGVYDGSSHGATGSATGVSGENLSNLLDLGASFTNAPGGTANWSFAGNGNYNAATGTADIVITKANASITVNGYAGVYDGHAHSATGSATGIKGENLSSLLNLGGSFTNVPGGTADWTFAGNGNYNTANGTANVTISKAEATIVVNGYTGVYDGNSHGATGSATGVSGENLSSLLDLGASFISAPGGTANWSFAGDGNYNSSNGTAQIAMTKANATIAVNGYTGVYDGSAHSASGSATGVSGEQLNEFLDLGTSFTNVPGGTANWSFAGNGNYNPASGTANIVITKANATITVNGYTGVYDGNPHGATGSATGVNGENLTGLNLGASFTNVPGGTANWSFAGNENYNAQNGDATITITPRLVTVSATGVHKIYDGNTNATVTFTDDRISGEDLTFSYTANFNSRNVGTNKSVSVSSIAISGGADAGNYSLSNTTCSTTANVTPLAITGSVTVQDKVYDATTAATINQRTLSGNLPGDDVSYTGGSATFSDRNVGNDKTVTATGLSLSGGDAINYTVNTTAMTAADITPLAITGSITAENKVYDGNTTATILARTLAGVLGTDAVKYIGGSATFNDKNVGTGKTVTATGLILSGDDAGNYTVNPTAQATANITALTITGAFTALNKVYDGTTNATIQNRSLNNVLPVDILNVHLAGGTATFANPNVGTWEVTGTGFGLTGSESGNYSLTSVSSTAATITPANTTATLTVTGPVQYSDQSTFTVTLSPDQILGVRPATAVQFQIDGVNVDGSQSLEDTGSSLSASITSPILLAPGSHAVTAIFQGVNSNFTVATASASLVVTQEDPRATYTGLIYVTTGSTSSSTATVVLSATIQDITAVMPASDAHPGDIRNAKVTFINRDTGAVIASNLPVSLVNSADKKTGTVSYAWSVNIGNADSATVTVGIRVDNYYARNDSSENTLVTVKKPTAGSIGGGGFVINAASTGQYAGTAGLKTNFGLNVKFNKSGSNLQGNVNIILRSVESGVVKVYQIKSNAIDSMNIQNPSGDVSTATFTSKANLTDITNPAAPVALGGNRILQITITDRGEPGGADSIGITLDGGASFSSRWSGTMTVEQTLDGGNLQVRPN